VPSAESISNEWARDGDTVTVYGNYFFPNEQGKLEQVLFAGNIEGTVVAFTQTSIDVIVPSGALTGSITITSIYGKGRSKFTFRDMTGIFINGENPEAWNWWSTGVEFSTEGGLDGAYVKLVGTGGDWAWPAGSMILYYFRNDGLLPSKATASDYALRFEMKSIHWDEPNMIIWFDNLDTPDIDAENVCQYKFAPYTIGTDYVKDWHTVTIPLAEFKHNKATGSSTMAIADAATVQNFYILPFGGAVAANPFELWMDNFRLVKIK
jgi:hypothetical protein